MQLLTYYIVYGNLLISLSAGSLAFACSNKLGSCHSLSFGLIVFFATLFLYNFQRIIRVNESLSNLSIRHKWILHHNLFLKIITALSAVATVSFYFLFLGWNIDFWWLIFTGIIGILYALKIHPNLQALRDIPYIKIYLIAFQWTIITTIWVWVRNYDSIQFPFALSSAVFFFILAATIPFDIRDLKNDSPNKLTVPQIFGIKKSKIIALLLLLISAICLCFAISGIYNHFAFYICYMGLSLLIIESETINHELYFSGLIDGWICVFSFLIFIG